MCPPPMRGVKGVATRRNGPRGGLGNGPGDGRRTATPGGRRAQLRTARRASRNGSSRGPRYFSQALTLSGLASTHFFAAASSDSLSTAMYLATVFWSSLVQLKFFTRS